MMVEKLQWRSRVRLVEQVVEVLRQRIYEGAFAPGAPLRQEQLAAELQVSRTPLREALRMLERDGMLVRDGDRVHLSEAGAGAAHAALERRDLWSAWLEHGWRLQLPDAREPDPTDLEATLGRDGVARLRALAARS